MESPHGVFRNLDLVSKDANFVGIDFETRIIRPLAVTQPKPPPVPRAGDRPFLDIAFGQRGSLMRTGIIDRLVASIGQMKDSDQPFTYHKGLTGTFRQLRYFCHRMKF